MRLVTVLPGFLSLMLASPAAFSWSATQPPLPDVGVATWSVAAGVSHGQDELWPIVRLDGRVGLSDRWALGLPCRLEIALLRPSSDSALVLAGGLTDLWISPHGQPLAAWAAALSGSVRLGAEAALRIGLGVDGVAGRVSADKSAWMEGGAAFLLDMGPYATVTLGLAYERLVVGPGTSREAARLGWVEDAHIQLLSAPFDCHSPPPMLAVHLPGGLDLLAVVTVDVEARSRQVTSRYLLGIGGAIGSGH